MFAILGLNNNREKGNKYNVQQKYLTLFFTISLFTILDKLYASNTLIEDEQKEKTSVLSNDSSTSVKEEQNGNIVVPANEPSFYSYMNPFNWFSSSPEKQEVPTEATNMSSQITGETQEVPVKRLNVSFHTSEVPQETSVDVPISKENQQLLIADEILKQYAARKGRTFEDLMASMLDSSPAPVKEERSSIISLPSPFSNEQPLSYIENKDSLKMPIYSSYTYNFNIVPIKSKKIMSGLSLWDFYNKNPEKKFKFTQVKSKEEEIFYPIV